MKPIMIRYLFILLTFVCCAGLIPKSSAIEDLPPALIILADQRFNPVVQRLLAREELKALPIGDARVIFVIPVYEDPMLEEMQIRYLKELIDQLETSEPSAD